MSSNIRIYMLFNSTRIRIKSKFYVPLVFRNKDDHERIEEFTLIIS